MGPFFTAHFSSFCELLTAPEPAEGQKDLSVDFELSARQVDGRAKTV